MKKTLLLLISLSISFSCKTGREINKNNTIEGEIGNEIKQIKVLTLGSFYFNFPNLDVVQTVKED